MFDIAFVYELKTSNKTHERIEKVSAVPRIGERVLFNTAGKPGGDFFFDNFMVGNSFEVIDVHHYTVGEVVVYLKILYTLSSK